MNLATLDPSLKQGAPLPSNPILQYSNASQAAFYSTTPRSQLKYQCDSKKRMQQRCKTQKMQCTPHCRAFLHSQQFPFFNGLYTDLDPRRITLYYIGFNLIAKYEVGVLRIVYLLNPTPDPVIQNLSLEMYRIFKMCLLVGIYYW